MVIHHKLDLVEPLGEELCRGSNKLSTLHRFCPSGYDLSVPAVDFSTHDLPND